MILGPTQPPIKWESSLYPQILPRLRMIGGKPPSPKHLAWRAQDGDTNFPPTCTDHCNIMSNWQRQQLTLRLPD